MCIFSFSVFGHDTEGPTVLTVLRYISKNNATTSTSLHSTQTWYPRRSKKQH